MNIDTEIRLSKSLGTGPNFLSEARQSGSGVQLASTESNKGLSEDRLTLTSSTKESSAEEHPFIEVINSVRTRTAALIEAFHSGDYPFNPERLVSHKTEVESLLAR